MVCFCLPDDDDDEDLGDNSIAANSSFTFTGWRR